MNLSPHTLLLASILLAVVGTAVLQFRTWRSAHWAYHGRLTRSALQDALAQDRQLDQAYDYLLRLLGLQPGDLPPTGGWAASADFLVILAEQILSRKPGLVVEFGSGISTLVIARCLQINEKGLLVSYEHNADFADLTRQRAERLSLPHDVRVVPLRDAGDFGYPGQWYLHEDCPRPIDLVVVDGPPMALDPETRGAAGPALVPLLAEGGALLLDDAGRPGERRIAERWRRDFPDLDFAFLATEKGTLIATKRSGARPD